MDPTFNNVYYGAVMGLNLAPWSVVLSRPAVGVVSPSGPGKMTFRTTGELYGPFEETVIDVPYTEWCDYRMVLAEDSSSADLYVNGALLATHTTATARDPPSPGCQLHGGSTD